IDAILDGSINEAEFEELPYFHLLIPKTLKGVNSNILNQKSTWPDPNAWDDAARQLAQRFIDNFKNFTDEELGKNLVSAGPRL
ncbi:MAG: phosphoenolpyruvate carboxykinase (ATP), partial [Candidatus Marinimicrobia bacterium]|nr:phosphoenolpyruvate carboxykinase (ATP) [Candidatus Neomarinimicrobiota bacterium]